MANRYYVQGQLSESTLELTGPEAHHLIQVMRAKAGEWVELFNGEGQVASAEIEQVHKKKVLLKLDRSSLTESPVNSHRHLILASAVPKGDRFRWLIEKSTELGVNRFIPLITERSVVTPRETKLDKQQQYVIEACKQSGRNHLMKIDSLVDMEDLWDTLPGNCCLLRGQPGVVANAWNQLQLNLQNPAYAGPVVILIGPEGGFSPAEIELLDQRNVHSIGCGSHILRTETAGLALISVLAFSLAHP